MHSIKIKHQTFANRCEICHQTDQYDPNTGHCLRCANITIPPHSHNFNRREIQHNTVPLKWKLAFNLIIYTFFIMLSFLFSATLGTILLLLLIISSVLPFLRPIKATFKNRYNKLIYFIPAQAHEFIDLDLRSIENYTQEMESLGFQRWGDYRVPLKERPDIFFRFFYHPESGAFSEIVHHKKGRNNEVYCNITSFFQNGISLNTKNSKIEPQYFPMALPDHIVIALPQRRLSEIFHQHLKMRTILMKEVNSSLLVNLSLDYFTDQAASQYQLMINKWENKLHLFFILEYFYYKLIAPPHNFGDYYQEVRRALQDSGI